MGNFYNRWKYQRSLVKQLKTRWEREYLTSLSEWRNKSNPISKPLSVGTLVLVKNEKKLHKWPLGIITKLFPSSDGQVIAVELKINNNITRRAVSLLVKLEIDNIDTNIEEPLPDIISPKSDSHKPVLSQYVTRKGSLITLPKRFCQFRASKS